MPKETMTSRERWLAVMRRQAPDRVPMDYWATGEATRRVMDHLGCASLEQMFERLHIDRIVGVGPAYAGPPVEPGSDMYGCRWRQVSYGAGVYSECVHHPLAGYDSPEEIAAHYTWPQVDWLDYSVIPAQVEGKDACPIRGGGSEPFLLYKNLRGMEQAYIDLIEKPELVHDCLDRLFDFCYRNTQRIYEQIPGRVDFSYIAEDLGSQESLLFSRAQIHEFLLPRMRRMIDLAHQAGAYVFFHSDGAIRDILPDLIEVGIDLLNPLQWRCRGMERQALKRDFGDRVVLHGGVDNQRTLAFGAVREVEDEVRYNLEVLGAGGGYILAPCHNIQAVSPPENVVALYDTGYRLGWR